MDYHKKLKCSSKECLFTTFFFDKLLTHYRDVHSFHHDFIIHCNFDGCLKSFANIKTFQKHVQRKHKNNCAPATEGTGEGNFIAEVTGEEGIGNAQDDSEVENGNKGSDCNQSLMQNSQEKRESSLMQYNYDQRLASFLVTMQEQYKVPNSALAFCTNEIKSWTEINNEQFGQRVKMEARLVGIEGVDIQRLTEEQNFQSAGAAERLSSKWKVDNYLRNHMFSYVEPIEIILEENDLGKKHTMQYVPILDNLKSLLQHEDILSQVLEDKHRTDVLSNYCDGELFSKSALFGRDPHALQIQLYCDDFTVVNPLGAPGRV